MQKRIVVFGQSHVRALADGYELLARADEAPVETVFVVYRPEQTVTWKWDGSAFQRQVSRDGPLEVLSTVDPTHVVLAWGGNQMNLRALLATERPFDVLLPSSPDTVVDPDVDLIPCSVVQRYALERMNGNETLLSLIAECHTSGRSVVLLPPPPPLPEAATRERLDHGPHFAKVLKELGASPATVPLVPEPVRQRLWVLLASAYATFAKEHGLATLEPPEDAFDDNGLLVADYWSEDPTHANGAYGASVLRRVGAWVDDSERKPVA